VSNPPGRKSHLFSPIDAGWNNTAGCGTNTWPDREDSCLDISTLELVYKMGSICQASIMPDSPYAPSALHRQNTASTSVTSDTKTPSFAPDAVRDSPEAMGTFYHTPSSTGSNSQPIFQKSKSIKSETELELQGPLEVAGSVKSGGSITFRGDFIIRDKIDAYGTITMDGSVSAK
jgi:hypothetical protein